MGVCFIMWNKKERICCVVQNTVTQMCHCKSTNTCFELSGKDIIYFGDIPTHLHQTPCDSYRSFGRFQLIREPEVRNLFFGLDACRM